MAKTHTRKIKKLVEGMGLTYISEGKYDSRGHPTHYILFMIDDIPEIRRVASAGSPRSEYRDTRYFQKKLRKIMSGRGMNIKIRRCLYCDETKNANSSHVCVNCHETMINNIN